MDDYITVTQTGASITTSGTSARVAIPLASSGEIPRYIRVGATAAACVALGKDNTIVATTNDMLLQPGEGAVVMVVPRGITYIAAIQVAAGGIVQISPIEDC